FQSALGSALNCGPIGKRVAKGYAQLNDVRSGLRKRHNELQRRIERGITCSNVRDNAEFAGFAQSFKSFVDSRFQDCFVIKVSAAECQSMVPRARANIFRLFPSPRVLDQEMKTAPPAQIAAEIVLVRDRVSVIRVEPNRRKIKSTAGDFH